MGLIAKRAIRIVATSVVGTALAIGSATAASASTGIVGAHRTGVVSCQSPDSVSFTTAAPVIKAVNTTPYVDRQKVSFQPVYFKWSGSAWVNVGAGMKLYGTATDAAAPGTFYDWATGQNAGNGAQTFGMIDRGHYAVAVRTTWYDATWHVTGSDYQWTATYLTPIGAVLPYCTR
jgi:hypothetical protein